MNERVKITSSHLSRQAIVYLRQSSAAQLENNRESTDRQYALAGKAREFGWPDERIVVIDEDLGLSGSGSTARSGFARLTSEVALARVGLVLGLEVSRLARNNAEWYRLIDLAGFTDTLIGDADGVYHPAVFNDRLLLGLKGTMSEAELYTKSVFGRDLVAALPRIGKPQQRGDHRTGRYRVYCGLDLASKHPPDPFADDEGEQNQGLAGARDQFGENTWQVENDRVYRVQPESERNAAGASAQGARDTRDQIRLAAIQTTYAAEQETDILVAAAKEAGAHLQLSEDRTLFTVEWRAPIDPLVNDALRAGYDAVLDWLRREADRVYSTKGTRI